MSGIYHEWNGTVLTVTSDSGTSSADLKGDDGCRGPQGPRGEQYFPVKGQDYMTEEEIQEVADKAAESLFPQIRDLEFQIDNIAQTVEYERAPLIEIGTVTADIDNLDNLPLNCVAWITPETVNNPKSGGFGLLETWGASTVLRVQRITYYSTHEVLTRTYANGKWYEWTHEAKTRVNCYTSNIDNLNKSGWYTLVNDSSLRPCGYPFSYAIMRVDAYKDVFFEQTLIFPNDGLSVKRTYHQGTFTEWRAVNPKLSTGVSYLTNDWFRGSRVCETVVTINPMPNTAQSSVVFDADGVTGVYSIDGYLTNGKYSLPISIQNTHITNIYASYSAGTLFVTTDGDMSAWTGYFHIKYTK